VVVVVSVDEVGRRPPALLSRSSVIIAFCCEDKKSPLGK